MSSLVERLIDHFLQTGLKDWKFAQETLERGKTDYALFFAHLAVEKLLKAHVARVRQEMPPRIHNLVKLAELSQLKDKLPVVSLAELNVYNLEGRYPEMDEPPPPMEEAARLFENAEQVITWLQQKL
ncbi:MAG: HEPN domain-containing protein [Candidatus Hydrogenedentes bacterium]|nr:HEPN domain-containing protein [Candidatus Hydrogenedentota bacterium]